MPVIDSGKHNLLGIIIDAVDYEAAVERIVVAARRRERCTCTALAVHGVMSGVLDPTHRYRLNHLDLVVPDGQPVRWGLNLLYRLGLRDRVYGPNLMLRLCEAAAREELPIFLYGSTEAVSSALASNLQKWFPALRIAGREPSKFRRLTPEEKLEQVERLRGSGAAITFVGMGCPRQEVWVYEFGRDLGMPSVAVGAAFDFHAGHMPQAPLFFQRRGLEWLHRWSKQPIRLWKRYLLLNPLYLLLLTFQYFGIRRFDSEATSGPEEELRFG